MFTYVCHKNQLNVGNIPYMDPMGDSKYWLVRNFRKFDAKREHQLTSWQIKKTHQNGLERHLSSLLQP